MRSQAYTNTHLNPALFPFGSSSDLHLQPSTYHCQIQAKSGDLIFHHFSYDACNGTWSSQPSQHEPQSIRIHDGETREFGFTCGSHYDHADDISIVNASLLKSADFTCTCTPA